MPFRKRRIVSLAELGQGFKKVSALQKWDSHSVTIRKQLGAWHALAEKALDNIGVRDAQKRAAIINSFLEISWADELRLQLSGEETTGAHEAYVKARQNVRQALGRLGKLRFDREIEKVVTESNAHYQKLAENEPE